MDDEARIKARNVAYDIEELVLTVAGDSDCSYQVSQLEKSLCELVAHIEQKLAAREGAEGGH